MMEAGKMHDCKLPFFKILNFLIQLRVSIFTGRMVVGFAQLQFNKDGGNMMILVVGSGGREAAMVKRLKSEGHNVFCAPGNAGIAKYATLVPAKATDFDGLLWFAREALMDLTIVGPEAPLVAGMVDQFRDAGLKICGPTALAAQTEGSKAWFKDFLAKHKLPTAPFRVFTDYEEALAYIRERGVQNIVIKADGLMGGKGVTLPNSLEEAESDLRALMVKGTAGEKVVIEDRLYGVERSVMAMIDVRTVYMLPFTQDYKREGDGDTGRNTGGMGAHTVTLPEDQAAELEQLVRELVNALADDGCTYSGFIYLGVMMTSAGPMILECNCRLGDPETGPILSSTRGELARLCMAIAEGNLHTVAPLMQYRQSLSVVLTSGEYPDASERDDAITGLPAAEATGAHVDHAGTGWDGTNFTTKKSGRVLDVIGDGDTLADARRIAYAGVSKIEFPGMKCRMDIGAEVV